jgi:hypothetical protein
MQPAILTALDIEAFRHARRFIIFPLQCGQGMPAAPHPQA